MFVCIISITTLQLFFELVSKYYHLMCSKQTFSINKTFFFLSNQKHTNQRWKKNVIPNNIMKQSRRKKKHEQQSTQKQLSFPLHSSSNNTSKSQAPMYYVHMYASLCTEYFFLLSPLIIRLSNVCAEEWYGPTKAVYRQLCAVAIS